MRQLSILLGRPSEWRKDLLLVCLSLTFVSAASLLYPWLLKLMVDRVSGAGHRLPGLPVLGAGLAAVFLVSALLGYHSQVIMSGLGFKLRNSVRLRMFGSLLARPMSHHRNTRVGDFSSRVTDDAARLQSLFTGLFAPAYQNFLFIAGCLILMLLLNPEATLIVVACTAICSVLILRFGSKLRTMSAKSQTDHAEGNALLEESLVGIREVKSFTRETSRLRQYATFLTKALSTELTAARSQARISQSLYLLFSSLLLGIFIAGTTGTVFPGWTLGGVIAFYFYTYTLVMAVVSSGKIVLNYQSLSGSVARLSEYLSDDPTEQPASIPACAPEVRGRIEFRNVAFAYRQDVPVLENCSFEIPEGMWTLLTGPSGSGKSTISHLLLGLDRPRRGEVFVDDRPLAQWDVGHLRRQIGAVGQEPILFHGTIEDNIVMGRAHPGIERLEELYDLCCLHELIASLPLGADTPIGERGVSLSGGQRVRIALARALLFRPPILILDEAGALLDPSLERTLWRKLERARRGATTLCISHRPPSEPRPDRHFQIRARRVEMALDAQELVRIG